MGYNVKMEQKETFYLSAIPKIMKMVKSIFAVGLLVQVVFLVIVSILLAKGFVLAATIGFLCVIWSLRTIIFSPIRTERICVDDKFLWVENSWGRSKKHSKEIISEIRVITGKKRIQAEFVDKAGKVILSTPTILWELADLKKIASVLGVSLKGSPQTIDILPH
jgi:hypothetical protein